MKKISTWDEAIAYLNGLALATEFETIIKQRMEMSHRSPELFQTIQAIAALDQRAEDPGPAIEWPGSSIAQAPANAESGEVAQLLRELLSRFPATPPGT